MQNRRHSTLLISLALFTTFFPCSAIPTRLMPQDKAHLLHDRFQLLTKVAALPAPVKSAFARAAHAPTFEMADPGQPFQVTDVIVDRRLLHRRLILAGRSPQYTFLWYEYGGIGRGQTVTLFRLSDHKAALVWSGFPYGPFGKPSLPALRDCIKRGKFYTTETLP